MTVEALRLLTKHGGHKDHGAHYREMALLVVRSAERYLRWLREDGMSDLSAVAMKILPSDDAEQILHRTPGLPALFVLQWLDLLRRIQELAA